MLNVSTTIWGLWNTWLVSAQWLLTHNSGYTVHEVCFCWLIFLIDRSGHKCVWRYPQGRKKNSCVNLMCRNRGTFGRRRARWFRQRNFPQDFDTFGMCGEMVVLEWAITKPLLLSCLSNLTRINNVLASGRCSDGGRQSGPWILDGSGWPSAAWAWREFDLVDEYCLEIDLSNYENEHRESLNNASENKLLLMLLYGVS